MLRYCRRTALCASSVETVSSADTQIYKWSHLKRLDLQVHSASFQLLLLDSSYIISCEWSVVTTSLYSNISEILPCISCLRWGWHCSNFAKIFLTQENWESLGYSATQCVWSYVKRIQQITDLSQMVTKTHHDGTFRTVKMINLTVAGWANSQSKRQHTIPTKQKNKTYVNDAASNGVACWQTTCTTLTWCVTTFEKLQMTDQSIQTSSGIWKYRC